MPDLPSPPTPSPPAPPAPTSAFLETLKTYRGTIEIAVATVAGIGTVFSSLAGQLTKMPILTAFTLLVILVATALFVRDVLRRRHIEPVNTLCFVGPQPLTRADRDRRGFYGRDADIEKIVTKLSDPAIHHLVLLGESGCGKTSLLLAGVLPQLDQQGTFHSLYLRFTDQPVRTLREVLRSVAPASAAAAEPAEPPPEPSLLDELREARKRAGKPIILFIDQFEEFHVNPVSAEDYCAVQELVWAIVGTKRTVAAKLVFCLRYDFLHLLDTFYNEEHVDERFASGQVRVRIEPFERNIAEDVLRKILRNKDGSLSWENRLVQRVLDDLSVTRVVHGTPRHIVLPAELQIVCQMVQTKGITTAAAYPGKKRLLLDHVSEAIDTMPIGGPAQARQLLIALVDANSGTKAKPQTLQQLADALSIKERGLPRLRRMLDYFDQQRRLVKSFSQQPKDSPSIVVYELAHDYLAGLIRTVAGEELTGVRRSQAILHSARLQAEYNPRYRLSIVQVWHLRRYPAEQMTSDDRALVRRSTAAFVLRVCTPTAALVALWATVRFGLVHLAIEKDEIVMKRGLPTAQPLLGSNDTTVASMRWRDGFAECPEGRALFARLREKPIRPEALSFLHANWNADRWLRQQLAGVVHIYTEGQQEISAQGIEERIDLLLALDLVTDGIANRLEQHLLAEFAKYQTQCSPDLVESASCLHGLGTLQWLAISLAHSRASNPTSIAVFRKQLRKATPDSWTFPAVLSALKLLHALDPDTRKAASDLASSSDAVQVAGAIQGLREVTPEKKPLLEKEAREQAIRTLWAGVQQPTADEKLQDKCIDALVALGLPDEPLVQLLYTQAEQPDSGLAERAIQRLLKLRVDEPRLIQVLTTIYESGARELSKIPNLEREFGRIPVSSANRELRISLNLLDSLWKADILTNHREALQEAIRKILKQYIRTNHRLSNSRVWTLIILSLRTGLRLSEIFQLATPGINRFEMKDAIIGALIRYGQFLKLEEQARLYSDSSLQKEMIEWVNQGIDSGNSSSCDLAILAINYHISHDAIEQRAEDPKCGVSNFPDVYARGVLLKRTEGFGQTAAETQGQAIDRLLDLLTGERAAKSTTYRSSIITAIRLIMRNLREHDSTQWTQLIERLRDMKKPESTPLHLRLALVELLNAATQSRD